jgi:hypothetical protein
MTMIPHVGHRGARCRFGGAAHALEHDPEKCVAFFGKDHAPSID